MIPGWIISDFFPRLDVTKEAWKDIIFIMICLVVWDSITNLGWGCVCPLYQQFSDSSRVSKNSTQFWHCLSRDSIRSYRLKVQSYRIPPSSPPPNSEASGKSRLLPVVLTSQLQIRGSNSSNSEHESQVQVVTILLTNWLQIRCSPRPPLRVWLIC